MTAASTSRPPVEAVVRDRATLKTLSLLALELRRGTVSGPENVAAATARALRSVVSAAKFATMEELVEIIRAAGRFLQESQVREQTVGNITRRVLHLLREEARAAENEDGEGQTSSMSSSFADLKGGSSANYTLPSSSSGSVGGNNLASGRSHATSENRLQSSTRPTLSSFRPGSTFSISDLVNAGANVGSGAASSAMPTPLGSGASTPAWASTSLEGLGYGVERLQVTEEKEDEEDGGDDEEDSEEEEGEEELDDEDDDEQNKRRAVEKKDASQVTKKKKGGAYHLKPLLIQAIQELIDELETVDGNIAKDARDHVHSGEVIFTIGYSHTVETFLRAAAKDRKFTVIVAESAPAFSGHKLVRALASSTVSTLLVPDSATFAVMPRISKVVLGAHSILANGGLLASAGSRIVFEAAKAHSTPTVVLAGVYKVCPDWAWVGLGTSLVNKSTSTASWTFTSGANSNQGPPAQVLPFDAENQAAEKVDVVNPLWDYVDPDLVDLLITNVGEHPVSLVYRLLAENYDAQDLVL